VMMGSAQTPLSDTDKPKSDADAAEGRRPKSVWLVTDSDIVTIHIECFVQANYMIVTELACEHSFPLPSNLNSVHQATGQPRYQHKFSQATGQSLSAPQRMGF
jgi:hypothetical protein